MKLSKVEAITNKMPKLETAEEISARVRISADRLVELAEAGFMPHWRIDGGVPLFNRAECQRWVDENVTNRNNGKPIPTHICLISDRAPMRSEDIPSALRNVRGLVDMTDLLGTHSGIYFLLLHGSVMYVGQSTSVCRRVGQHSGNKEFDQVLFMPWPANDLDRVERAFISFLLPPGNFSNPTGLPIAITYSAENDSTLKECINFDSDTFMAQTPKTGSDEIQ